MGWLWIKMISNTSFFLVDLTVLLLLLFPRLSSAVVRAPSHARFSSWQVHFLCCSFPSHSSVFSVRKRRVRSRQPWRSRSFFILAPLYGDILFGGKYFPILVVTFSYEIITRENQHLIARIARYTISPRHGGRIGMASEKMKNSIPFRFFSLFFRLAPYFSLGVHLLPPFGFYVDTADTFDPGYLCGFCSHRPMECRLFITNTTK